MGSIGPAEIIVVLVVALIVLGPARLPGAARSLGRAISEVRRVANGFQDEVREAFAEPRPSFSTDVPDHGPDPETGEDGPKAGVEPSLPPSAAGADLGERPHGDSSAS